MSRFTVVYLEPVPPAVEQVVRSRLPVEFDLRVRRENEPVESVLADADFVLVATTPLPEQTIAGASRLRLIQHQGVGYDKTDVFAAKARGIPVALCPAGTSIGVAEHVFLLILALYKRLLEADPALRHGKWLQWELRPFSYEIAGKTLGILGFGRIGREVARRARAFHANVIYSDVTQAPPEVEHDLGAHLVPFAVLLARADILSLHLPLTPETHHLIGAPEFEQMRPSAILINTARGPLVDERALVEALRAGKIAAAGLDVFETEPLPSDHPLFSMSNVVLTPHIAAGSQDALVTKMDACFANMLRVARDQPPVDVVDS